MTRKALKDSGRNNTPLWNYRYTKMLKGTYACARKRKICRLRNTAEKTYKLHRTIFNSFVHLCLKTTAALVHINTNVNLRCPAFFSSSNHSQFEAHICAHKPLWLSHYNCKIWGKHPYSRNCQLPSTNIFIKAPKYIA